MVNYIYNISDYYDYYYTLFITVTIICAVLFSLCIITLIITKKNYEKNKTAVFLDVLFIGALIYNLVIVVPRLIKINTDMETNQLIEEYGTLDMWTGRSDSLEIDGRDYYLLNKSDPINTYVNVGKTVRFLYYENSKCIYSIEVVE